MPNPKICNRIADPAARRRCLNYQGEFAQQGDMGVEAPAVGPSRQRGTSGGRGGFGGRGGRGGRGGFSGGY